MWYIPCYYADQIFVQQQQAASQTSLAQEVQLCGAVSGLVTATRASIVT